MWSVIIRRYRSEAKQTGAQMLSETAEENFFRSLLCITENPSIKKEQALDIWLSAQLILLFRTFIPLNIIRWFLAPSVSLSVRLA